MGMKASDMVYFVCDDCHTFKMGHKSLRTKKSFTTCDGCGQAMRELK
jgi:RNase P subunit RPR2